MRSKDRDEHIAHLKDRKVQRVIRCGLVEDPIQQTAAVLHVPQKLENKSTQNDPRQPKPFT